MTKVMFLFSKEYKMFYIPLASKQQQQQQQQQQNV